MSKKCLVIYNPNSGKGIKQDKIKQYKKVFADRGYIADFYATKRAGDVLNKRRKLKDTISFLQ